MNRSKAAALIAAIGSTVALGGCASQRDVLQKASAGPDAPQCDARIENQAALIDVFRDDRATTLAASNDGWCGTYIRLIRVTWPVDWTAGALYEPPAHGTVRLRDDGSVVHVEYRANPGYVGPDAFAVRLQPGFAIRRTTVQAVAATGGAGRPRAEVGITSSQSEELRRRAPQG